MRQATLLLRAAVLVLAIQLSQSSVDAVTIDNPSYLQVNLGPIPFDHYDTVHLASNDGLSCPANSSVRACFQTILQNWHSQKVQGVRFQFALCGGFYSTPLVNCGQTYTNVSGPSSAWLANVSAFFADIHNAGINNITLTPSQFGFGFDKTVTVNYQTPPVGPSGLRCSDTPLQVVYWAAAPFGLKANAYPIGQGDNTGYNCAPANPYFVGWTNTYNVINGMLGQAQTNGLTVFELDDFNEMDLINFPVELRFIIDNAQTQTGNPDSFYTLRYAMTAHSFDPARITWSTGVLAASVAGFNCTDVYTDYARLQFLDAEASGLGAGYIGYPSGFMKMNGLLCGGGTAGMYKAAVSHSQPDIIDVHDYPSVQSEATIDFNDIPHFLALLNVQSAIFMLGETNSNTNSGGVSCENKPLAAPVYTVNGYNLSALAGHTTYFRPWSYIANSCYSYPNNQDINLNNAGPYTPTLQ